VLYNVGGIYLTEVKSGTKGERHVAVPKAVQKASLKWVLNEYKNIDWIDNSSLKEKFPLAVNGSYSIRNAVLREIKGMFGNVVLSAHYSASPYTVEEFTKELYDATWSSLLKGGKLTNGDKLMQQFMVELFCEPLTEKQQAQRATGVAYSVDEIIAYGLDKTGLVERFADAFRQYEKEHEIILPDYEGAVSCHSGSCQDTHFGTTGYGFQSKVSVDAIDDSKSHLRDLAVKSRDLLRSRLSATSGSTRAHYLSLLIQLNNVLKDKL
jgi:hypothetical protein